MLNTRDGDGITAWIEVAPGSKMYYELKIPLSELVEPENPEQNQISVGFESGKIEMPSSGGHASGFNPSMGMTSGGGRQGGGDGRSGGGGGGNPQHQQSMQAMSQPIDVWIKRIQLFY